MTKRERRTITLTPEQRARHAEIRRQVERDKTKISREALDHKAELDALIEAFQALKHEREVRGLSLGDIARRSGIDKSYLSKLENDPYPNPTLTTLVRIAGAIGVRLTIQVNKAA